MELWLTMFLVAVAHDVDARSNTMHGDALRRQMWEKEPQLLLEIAVADLREMVTRSLSDLVNP